MTLTDASRTLPVNGVDLAWSEQGAGGTTLVLCHGFTGSSHDFALEVDALAGKRRVVTLDQRGHGHSTKTGTLQGYSIPQLSSDLAGFLDAVGGVRSTSSVIPWEAVSSRPWRSSGPSSSAR